MAKFSATLDLINKKVYVGTLPASVSLKEKEVFVIGEVDYPADQDIRVLTRQVQDLMYKVQMYDLQTYPIYVDTGTGGPTVIVPVTSVAFTPATVKLRLGQSDPVKFTIIPDNATNKTVVITSENTEIVSITDNDTLVGRKAGTTTITITTEDSNRSASATVTVE